MKAQSIDEGRIVRCEIGGYVGGYCFDDIHTA